MGYTAPGPCAGHSSGAVSYPVVRGECQAAAGDRVAAAALGQICVVAPGLWRRL